jgi:hypothetical protein
MRRTSIECYNKIRDNGLLSRVRWKIYDCLYKYGPLTTRQVYKRLGITDIGNISSGLAAMRTRGCVDEEGEVVCEETGHTVILWDVTNRLPLKLDKPRKIKCKLCDGKGYHVEQQSKFL